jgi:hypothetical protein
MFWVVMPCNSETGWHSVGAYASIFRLKISLIVLADEILEGFLLGLGSIPGTTRKKK